MQGSAYYNLTVNRISNTRSNKLKITGKRFHLYEAKNFFNSIVNTWNSLPTQVVNCETLDQFKRKLDAHVQSSEQIAYFPPHCLYIFLISLLIFHSLAKYFSTSQLSYSNSMSVFHTAWCFFNVFLPTSAGGSGGWGRAFAFAVFVHLIVV